jgi:N-acetyl-anhydromuramyl-L-alanine amidase AmpD
VFQALARGGSFAGRDDETITLAAHDATEIPPALTIDVSNELHALAGAEYPGAEWIPTSCTNKCDATRGGESVARIVIHDTEGGWDASVATLQNDPEKSVHYIVGQDGRVAQFVTEATTAWHAGNYYYNQRSVGIEHVGYGNKTFPEAEYAASAKLVDYLATKYSVLRDREHIVGHDQVPDGDVIGESDAPCSAAPKSCEAGGKYGGANNHTDPGDWEWAEFMARIGGTAKCDDVTSIWNCSADKTHAARCDASGDVEVATCDGACQVQPDGVDDVCNVAPQTSPPPVAADPDPPPAETTEAAPLPASPPPPQDSGCSVTRASSSTGSGGALRSLFVLALGAIVVFARRVRIRRDP